MASRNWFSFRPGSHAVALTAVLLIEAGFFYTAEMLEKTPQIPPLSAFPVVSQDWAMVRDFPIEPDVMAVLKADDVLSRAYVHPASGPATLFVAYFRSQRTGQAPHSPKNCLPGSGFMPVSTGFVDVDVPGRDQPITINQYVVARGEESSVVLYWYQSRGRVIASEYAAKIWLVLDSVRYHRSDTALVRVVVPIGQRGADAARQAGLDMIRTFFPLLQTQLTPFS